jgi:GNAT superfamily N-acetyltransferase
MTLYLHEIESLFDDRLPGVLDIYQESFPPREQMRLSWWVQLLRQKTAGQESDEGRHLVAIVRADDDQVVGMAYYETYPLAEGGGGSAVGYLWYLATRSDLRGQRIGAGAYAALIERILGQAGCRAVVFEVEIPEEAARFSEGEAEFARRRIAWYQRNGAKLLRGIRYVQDVGWQPPVPMHLMIHSRDAIDAGAAFTLVQTVLEDAVEQVGPLSLE